MIDLAALFPRADSQAPPTAIGTFVLASAVKILVVFVLYLVGVALLTLAERKLAAWFQDRRGPNRVGPGGLLQPVADGLKNFMKEETKPALADRWLFLIAPALAFIPAMMTWAVLPLAAPLPTPWGLIDMAVASLPVGFLFTLAICVAGRVRHRARRLVVEQQVRAAGRPALERADDLVRDRDGHVAPSRSCCSPATSR